jgi:hypothetical protein
MLNATVDGGSGSYTYTWLEANAEIGPFTIIENAVSNSYSALTTETGTKYYKVEVIDNSNGCNAKTSDIAKVTVNPDISITIEPNNKAVCLNESTELIVLAEGGSGNYSYQWMVANTEDGIYSEINGETNNTLNIQSNTSETKYYKVSVNDNKEGCNNIISRVAEVITVETEGGEISSDQSLCVGEVPARIIS